MLVQILVGTLTLLTEAFQGFLQSVQSNMLGQCFKYVMTASFQILSSSPFSSHSTIDIE